MRQLSFLDVSCIEAGLLVIPGEGKCDLFEYRPPKKQKLTRGMFTSSSPIIEFSEPQAEEESERKNQCLYSQMGYGTVKAHTSETAMMEHLIKMHNFEKCGFREWLHELKGDQPNTFQICGVSEKTDEEWQVDEAIRMTGLSAALLRTTLLFRNLVDNDLYTINSQKDDNNIPSIFLALFAVLKAKEVVFDERYEPGHPMELVWSREENDPFRLNAPPPHLNSCRDRFYRAVFEQNADFNQFCGSNFDASLPEDFYTKDFNLEKQKKVMQWTAEYFKVRIIMLVIDSQNTKFCLCGYEGKPPCRCDEDRFWFTDPPCDFCIEDNKIHPDPWLLEFDGTDIAVTTMEEPVILVRQCVVGTLLGCARQHDHEYRWTGVSIACQCKYGVDYRKQTQNERHITRMWQASRNRPVKRYLWNYHDWDRPWKMHTWWRYKQNNNWYPFY